MEKDFDNQYKLDGKIYAGILSQIRLLDSRRLSRKIGLINKGDFSVIIEKIHNLLP